ncbi:Uncharacterized protein AC501_5237 [Pseudomonas amygdali pv. lachrymans]|nr:Uncharacterized protein AC501_5237 [Pseudomonas amygdali pv. lachrymans]
MYGALGSATLKVGVTGRAFSKKNFITQQTELYFQIKNLGRRCKNSQLSPPLAH